MSARVAASTAAGMADPADPFVAAVAAAGLPVTVSWIVAIRPQRHTIGMSVKAGGQVVIAVPPRARPEQVADFVARKRGWLLPRVDIAQQERPQHPVKELVDGEGFDLLGLPHRLRLVAGDGDVRVEPAPSGSHASRHICLPRKRRQSADALVRWYQSEGLGWVRTRAGRWEARLALHAAPHYVVRDLGGRRWGLYASASHTVTLHWTLFQLPTALADYVLVHELVHAARPGGKPHGREFTALLTRVMPDWRGRKARLRELGRKVWRGDLAGV